MARSSASVKVEIFCESGREIGLGHLYRCIKLARICAQIPEVAMITIHNRGDFAPPLSKILREMPAQPTIHYQVEEWLCGDWSPQAFGRNPAKDCTLAIVDSYVASEAFYTYIQQRSGALICLDDTLRDVYPSRSYILNPMPESKAYFAEKPYYLWCGEEFAIVPQIPTDTESHSIKQDSTMQDGLGCRHIFVNFGGVDSRNLTQTLVQALCDYPESSLATAHFHIALGGGYAHELCLSTKHSGCTSVYRDLSVDAFLFLAKQCDYAISAGGGSMLELLGLKIPSIIIESASNQRAQIAHFASQGAILHAQNPQAALAVLFDALESMDSKQLALTTLTTALNKLQLGIALPKALRNVVRILPSALPSPH